MMPPVKASAGGTNAEGSSRRGGYPQGAPRPAVAPQGRERRFRRSAALDGKCLAVPAPEGVTAGGAQRRPGYAGPRHKKARARPEGARAVVKALFAPPGWPGRSERSERRPGQPDGAQARRARSGERSWLTRRASRRRESQDRCEAERGPKGRPQGQRPRRRSRSAAVASMAFARRVSVRPAAPRAGPVRCPAPVVA